MSRLLIDHIVNSSPLLFQHTKRNSMFWYFEVRLPHQVESIYIRLCSTLPFTKIESTIRDTAAMKDHNNLSFSLIYPLVESKKDPQEMNLNLIGCRCRNESIWLAENQKKTFPLNLNSPATRIFSHSGKLQWLPSRTCRLDGPCFFPETVALWEKTWK